MQALRLLRRNAAALWILALAFLAGALNAAGFLRYGQTLSHMTGNLLKLGLSLSGREAGPALWFLSFLLCFTLGALLSGFAFPKPVKEQWRRCALVMLAGGLLLLLPQALGLSDLARASFLAMALGAQNGLTLRYRGTLMRTTHVTGHLTDVGAALGRLLHEKGLKGEDLREFLLHLFSLLAFLLGVVLAALYPRHQGPGLTALVLCGLCYFLFGILILLVLWARNRAVE